MLRPSRTMSGALLCVPLLTLLMAPQHAAAALPTDPPPVSINTHGGDNGDGDVFIGPYGGTSAASGPEIIDNHGNVVWFHALPPGLDVADFRAQTYQGKPVLTWWQGQGFGTQSAGVDEIYDQSGQPLTTVTAGNGFSADGHEFLITPQNTALITVYTTTVANLTSIGGPPAQVVLDGVVQEVDIATGRVIFQWDSDGQVPFSESEQPLPPAAGDPWDWFHVNAVHLDTDGNLLIDGRDTWTVYKINRTTGAIIWRLGGKHSSFTVQAGPGQQLDSAGQIFSWQHDPEALGGGAYTLFDNDSAGSPNLPYSRGVTLQLDETQHMATLTGSIAQPQGLSAASQGNFQSGLVNGDHFIGWGALGRFSEFDSGGSLVLDAQLAPGFQTYRAYRLPWSGSVPFGVPEVPAVGLVPCCVAVVAAAAVLARRRP